MNKKTIKTDERFKVGDRVVSVGNTTNFHFAGVFGKIRELRGRGYVMHRDDGMGWGDGGHGWNIREGEVALDKEYKLRKKMEKLYDFDYEMDA